MQSGGDGKTNGLTGNAVRLKLRTDDHMSAPENRGNTICASKCLLYENSKLLLQICVNPSIFSYNVLLQLLF